MASAAGAISGVFAAFTSWAVLFYQGLSSEEGLREFVLHLKIGENSYEVMPVVVMLASSLVTMIVVSMVTPKPKDETLAKFFEPAQSAD